MKSTSLMVVLALVAALAVTAFVNHPPGQADQQTSIVTEYEHPPSLALAGLADLTLLASHPTENTAEIAGVLVMLVKNVDALRHPTTNRVPFASGETLRLIDIGASAVTTVPPLRC